MFAKLSSTIPRLAKTCQIVSPSVTSFCNQSAVRLFTDVPKFDVLNPIKVNEKSSPVDSSKINKPNTKTSRPPRSYNNNYNNNKTNNSVNSNNSDRSQSSGKPNTPRDSNKRNNGSYNRQSNYNRNSTSKNNTSSNSNGFNKNHFVSSTTSANTTASANTTTNTTPVTTPNNNNTNNNQQNDPNNKNTYKQKPYIPKRNVNDHSTSSTGRSNPNSQTTGFYHKNEANKTSNNESTDKNTTNENNGKTYNNKRYQNNHTNYGMKTIEEFQYPNKSNTISDASTNSIQNSLNNTFTSGSTPRDMNGQRPKSNRYGNYNSNYNSNYNNNYNNNYNRNNNYNNNRNNNNNNNTYNNNRNITNDGSYNNNNNNTPNNNYNNNAPNNTNFNNNGYKNSRNNGYRNDHQNNNNRPRYNRDNRSNSYNNNRYNKYETDKATEEDYPDIDIPVGPFNLPFTDEVKENLLTKPVTESEMFEDMKDKSVNPIEITEGEDIEPDSDKWRKQDYTFNGAPISIETRQYVIPQTRETDARELHPGNRKVILRLHVKDLKLPIMTAQKLVLLSGPRYNFNNDLLTLTADRYPMRRQNARWLVDTLESLIQEASVPTIIEEQPTLKPLKTPTYPFPMNVYNSTK